MATVKEKIDMSITTGDWSDDVQDWLGLMRDVTDRDIQIYRDAVASGRFFLRLIRADGRAVGALIWSRDRQPDGVDLVINAAGSYPVPGVDITGLIYNYMRFIAAKEGARALRCWTIRAGLVRKLRRHGFAPRFELEAVL
jgi:hypothetical protein